MESIPVITAFLGWCTVINIGLLTLSFMMTIIFNMPVKKLHSKMTHIAPEKLDELYFNFLGHYKLGIFLFNLVPYCALKIMGF